MKTEGRGAELRSRGMPDSKIAEGRDNFVRGSLLTNCGNPDILCLRRSENPKSVYSGA